jgi:hypothetical protein
MQWLQWATVAGAERLFVAPLISNEKLKVKNGRSDRLKSWQTGVSNTYNNASILTNFRLVIGNAVTIQVKLIQIDLRWHAFSTNHSTQEVNSCTNF